MQNCEPGIQTDLQSSMPITEIWLKSERYLSLKNSKKIGRKLRPIFYFLFLLTFLICSSGILLSLGISSGTIPLSFILFIRFKLYWIDIFKSFFNVFIVSSCDAICACWAFNLAFCCSIISVWWAIISSCSFTFLLNSNICERRSESSFSKEDILSWYDKLFWISFVIMFWYCSAIVASLISFSKSAFFTYLGINLALFIQVNMDIIKAEMPLRAVINPNMSILYSPFF